MSSHSNRWVIERIKGVRFQLDSYSITEEGTKNESHGLSRFELCLLFIKILSKFNKG